MNFLAHLYLSADDPKIMVGNFIGDFVKGRHAKDQFEPGIRRGIDLHRAIDEFTDSHEVVQQSKKRLRPKYRHYSGVIVDVFYDHYLARNWSYFHGQGLPDFAERSYDLLEQHAAVLPNDVKFMLPYMVRGNWLVNYARVEGIHRALSGMAQRTPYESKMDEASADLETHYDAFSAEFQKFFPELKAFADDFLGNN